MTRAELCEHVWRDYWYTQLTTGQIARAYKVSWDMINANLNNHEGMPEGGRPADFGGPDTITRR